MKNDNSRRSFIKTSVLGASASPLFFTTRTKKATKHKRRIAAILDRVLSETVLKKSLFQNAVILDSVELLHYQGNYLCRVRSTNGAEGISVSNNMQMTSLYPIFTKRIQPFFKGKNAVELEQLIEELYVYKSNYKLQSLAIWVPVATVEFAILDMLGKIADKSIGSLIGQVQHNEIAVYQANNFRGKSAEISLERIKQQVATTQPNALKIKIGGRMSQNKDYPPGRTEKLIPLVREAFGKETTLYADSNGSYTTEEAIRIGKLLETYQYDFYEEPVPFDWYEETKQVTKTLKIPIAGGEQEGSMRNFRWLILNDGLDIVQPDPFYFGGMIRSMKVAKMAAVKNKLCVPHISGSGLGYLYMMHFVAALDNAGPYHEFKGFNTTVPVECPTSDLQIHNGRVKVPTGPGLGILIDPDYIAKHELVN